MLQLLAPGQKKTPQTKTKVFKKENVITIWLNKINTRNKVHENYRTQKGDEA